MSHPSLHLKSATQHDSFAKAKTVDDPSDVISQSSPPQLVSLAQLKASKVITIYWKLNPSTEIIFGQVIQHYLQLKPRFKIAFEKFDVGLIFRKLANAVFFKRCS
jgi:hypothetical protein